MTLPWRPGKQPMEGHIGIVALVPGLWGDLWQVRHHVLSRMAESLPVLWVSPPTYIESWRKDGYSPDYAGRGVHKVNDRLWTYAPRLPADYKRAYTRTGVIPATFRRYHAWWLRRHAGRIASLARKMGIRKTILYVWRPEFAEQVDHIPHDLLCYHIDDEYSFSPDKEMPISEDEMKLLREADLVFIHSRTLMEKKGGINPNTHYVPNGVDFDLYRAAMESSDSEPEDLRAIPHPRIGYVGYIKRHLDLPLLLAIARARRDWSLVLVGPERDEHADIAADIAALRSEPNVHFLGGKPARDLPCYTKHCDVCLLPYRQTHYTKYIYPLKLHEYLACGKPVVATSLENLREFDDVLCRADGADEWANAIARALDLPDRAARDARIAIARASSWEIRVAEIVASFSTTLEQNG